MVEVLSAVLKTLDFTYGERLGESGGHRMFLSVKWHEEIWGSEDKYRDSMESRLERKKGFVAL